MSKDNAARITALVEARARGDEREVRRLRSLLVIGNEGLVRRLATRYGKSRSEADVEDMVQAGAMGLMRALDTFDPTRGIKFSTYATHWIRDHMQRWGGKAETVARPRGTSMPAPIAKAAARHRALRGTEPTAQDLGITEEELTAWSQAPHFVPVSSASSEGHEDGVDLPDDTDEEATLHEAMSLRSRWERVAEGLSERDLRIGWAVLVEGESLRSVAARWDLSHVHVFDICERVAKRVEKVPA